MLAQIEDRYSLQIPLGRQEAGTIWKAEDIQNKRAVAIGVLTDGNEATSEQFVERGKTLQKISHPNVVRVREVARSKEGPCWIMELLSGQSLADRLSDRPALSVQELVRITMSALDGLRATHQNGIVHGDIEPGNLFVLKGNRVKIINFGINRATARSGGVDDTSGLIRTLVYTAPEQATDGPSVTADLYGIGAILYHSLCGADHNAISALPGERLPLAEVCPQLKGPLADCVDKSLSARPSERFTDASTMRRALMSAVLGVPEIGKLPIPVVGNEREQTVQFGTKRKRSEQKAVEPSGPRQGQGRARENTQSFGLAGRRKKIEAPSNTGGTIRNFPSPVGAKPMIQGIPVQNPTGNVAKVGLTKRVVERPAPIVELAPLDPKRDPRTPTSDPVPAMDRHAPKSTDGLAQKGDIKEERTPKRDPRTPTSDPVTPEPAERISLSDVNIEEITQAAKAELPIKTSTPPQVSKPPPTPQEVVDQSRANAMPPMDELEASHPSLHSLAALNPPVPSNPPPMVSNPVVSNPPPVPPPKKEAPLRSTPVQGPPPRTNNNLKAGVPIPEEDAPKPMPVEDSGMHELNTETGSMSSAVPLQWIIIPGIVLVGALVWSVTGNKTNTAEPQTIAPETEVTGPRVVRLDTPTAPLAMGPTTMTEPIAVVEPVVEQPVVEQPVVAQPVVDQPVEIPEVAKPVEAPVTAKTAVVKLTNLPFGAVATLDGRRVAKASKITVPIDGKVHQLEVSAKGRERFRRSIATDGPLTLKVTMPRVTSAPRTTPRTTTPRTTTPRTTTPRTTTPRTMRVVKKPKMRTTKKPSLARDPGF